MLSLAPASLNTAKFSVDDAERSRVIEGAAKLLVKVYVLPNVATNLAQGLRARHKRGEYQNITDAEVFATRLEDDLCALSGDKHMSVDFFAEIMPPNDPARRPRPDLQQLAASNCGFEKAEHFPPNIGYLKLNAFAEPAYCTPTAIAAMNFLADSDALIVDLRDNRGGAPRMAALVSSYLFDEPTHLDDILNRKANTTEQLWTIPYLPGKNFADKPFFVLTSSRTFFAAEQFSYDLKAFKRATLVGEITGGGAHLVAP